MTAPAAPSRQRARAAGELVRPGRGPRVRDLRAGGLAHVQPADRARTRPGATLTDLADRPTDGRPPADRPTTDRPAAEHLSAGPPVSERRAGGSSDEEPAGSPTPPEPAGDPAPRAPDGGGHLPRARAAGAPARPPAPAAASALSDPPVAAVAATPPTGVRELRYAAGDLVVVSGLPGSGKSTLIRRVVPTRDAQDRPVRRVDSQDARDRWERRMPPWLAYSAYRPLVRLAHYAGLRRAVRSGDSVVVHDCGTMPWVRRWLARCARRRGVALHLVLLDVPPRLALAGQAARGRGVTLYAFGRHRAAVGRLRAEALAGTPPAGCASAVLLDRTASGALADIGFD